MNETKEKGASPMTTIPTNTDDKPKKEKKDRWWLLPIIAMAAAVFVNLFILINARVPSGSMEPTIPVGSLMLGSRIAYLWDDPQVGDVVLFHHPEFDDKYLVKRVVAVPGQTFSLQNGRVYLDGQLLEEDYVAEFSADSYPETTVPEGCYLVMGDNRRNSNDSRFWMEPFVRREDIIAKALFTYFPQPGLL